MLTDSSVTAQSGGKTTVESESSHRQTVLLDTAIGLFLLTRPWNVFLIGLAVLAGALIGPDTVDSWTTLGRAALTLCLIAAGGYALNDVFDVGSDRVNKPLRPLVRGAVGMPAAAFWAVLYLAAGAATAASLPSTCFSISLMLLGMVVLYDVWGKGQPLVGNLMTSIMVSSAFPVGSLAGGQGWWGLVPGVLAFLLYVPMEILKDLEDMPGDSVKGYRTLPLVIGEQIARRLAQLVLIILLLILPFPVIQGWMGPGYLAVAILGVGIPIAALIWRLNLHEDAAGYKGHARIIKRCVVTGLLALLIG